MSSSAPVVTSVSTPITDVMESLIAVIAQMSKPVVSIQIWSYYLSITQLDGDIFGFSIVLDCTNMLFAAFSDVSQLLGLLVCATMKVSSSANQTAAVSHQPGNVTAIQTVKMAATNTTPAHLAPVPPRCSAVTMGTVCYAAGFATATTTAGT